MISVCIPTYCYDTRKLAETIYRQSLQLSVPVEIIVIDDGSPAEWQQLNATIQQTGTYIALRTNIGRAAVRNLFLKYSRYDWLLYLDSDVMPVDSNFMDRYLEAIVQNPMAEVFCGGIRMPQQPDDPRRMLRWHYGNKRECRTVTERQQYPYRSFMTGNFCIKKSTLTRFPFDERLRQYGHEDTLLGFRLMQHQVPLLHIDNPVYHLHMEETDVFVRKTENAVANLYHIATDLLANEPLFIAQNKLLRTACFLRKYRLMGIIRGVFRLLRPLILWLLTSTKPKLWLFDIYKLGCIGLVMKKDCSK